MRSSKYQSSRLLKVTDIPSLKKGDKLLVVEKKYGFERDIDTVITVVSVQYYGDGKHYISGKFKDANGITRQEGILSEINRCIKLHLNKSEEFLDGLYL